jgi:hypothetical protein
MSWTWIPLLADGSKVKTIYRVLYYHGNPSRDLQQQMVLNTNSHHKHGPLTSTTTHVTSKPCTTLHETHMWKQPCRLTFMDWQHYFTIVCLKQTEQRGTCRYCLWRKKCTEIITKFVASWHFHISWVQIPFSGKHIKVQHVCSSHGNISMLKYYNSGGNTP